MLETAEQLDVLLAQLHEIEREVVSLVRGPTYGSVEAAQELGRLQAKERELAQKGLHEVSVSSFEAYHAMRILLGQYWDTYGDEALTNLLSLSALHADGMSADPQFVLDWLKTIAEVKRGARSDPFALFPTP
jgi:hypothetical protein